MTVTSVTEPTYVMPGRACEVTLSASVGNYVRLVLTSAPEASSWAKRLRDENLSEVQLWAIQSGQKHKFTFDVPGTYVCTAREYTRGGVSFGGDYLGDPDGDPTETAVGTTAITFAVGQRMTATMQIGRDSGTLVLWVWSTTVRPTTVPVHGEVSPRIDGDTPRMRIAAQDSSVLTALAAMGNVGCTTVAGGLHLPANDIIAKFNAHIQVTTSGSGVVHSDADTFNTIDLDYRGARNAVALTETVSRISGKMRAHYLNDSGTGTATAGFHAYADWDNLPMLTGAGDALSASLALASLWHSFEEHRADTGVHGRADGVNALTALAPLYAVYQKVIAVLQSDNPTAPATDNAGAVLLTNRAGLVKA